MLHLGTSNQWNLLLLQVVAAAGAIMVVARWAAVAEDGAGEVDRHPTKPSLSPLSQHSHLTQKPGSLSFHQAQVLWKENRNVQQLPKFIYLKSTMYSSWMFIPPLHILAQKLKIASQFSERQLAVQDTPPHMLHSKCWMNMLYKYQWRIMPKIHPCLLNCNY